MLFELGVLWIFLALLSGAHTSAYLWQRRSDDTHPDSDGGTGAATCDLATSCVES
jgi:hypothetical protein